MDKYLCITNKHAYLCAKITIERNIKLNDLALVDLNHRAWIVNQNDVQQRQVLRTLIIIMYRSC